MYVLSIAVVPHYTNTGPSCLRNAKYVRNAESHQTKTTLCIFGLAVVQLIELYKIFLSSHYEIIFCSLNFSAKNAALTKKISARVIKIYEAKKLEISGILCGETNFIRKRENISMIIIQ